MDHGKTTFRNKCLRHLPIKTSGIYKITNITDGKFYIGSAKNIRRRLRMHLMLLRKGVHTSTHLQHAYNRDGEIVFEFALLEEVDCAHLYEREQAWLDDTQCYNDAIGYNICRIAGPPPRCEFTPEMRDAISKRFKGKPKSEEHRRRISEGQIGKVVSQESIEKARASLNRFWSNPETRAAQSRRKKGCVPHNKGKSTVSKSLAEKQRAGMKAYWRDPENRAAQVALNLGKPSVRKGATHTEAVKKALSLAAKKRLQTQKAKQSLKKAQEMSRTETALAKRSMAMMGKHLGRPNLGNRKYSDADVAQWRLLKDSGMSYGKIAQRLGVNVAVIFTRLKAVYRTST